MAESRHLLLAVVLFIVGYVSGKKNLFRTRCDKKDYRPCEKDWYFIETQTEVKCVYVEQQQRRYQALGPQDWAKFQCRNDRGRLVEIYSKEFQDRLFDIIKQPEHSYRKHFFIGMQYLGNDTKPRWESFNDPVFKRQNLPLPYWRNNIRRTLNSSVCYAIETSKGEWVEVDCETRLMRICMKGLFTDKPMAPTLDVRFDAEPNVMFTSNNFTATCKAFVGTTRKMSLIMKDKVATRVIRNDDPSVSTIEAFYLRNKICSKFATTSFTIKVRDYMAGRIPQLLCMIHLPRVNTKDMRCNKNLCKGHRVVFRDKNSSPVLNVHYHDTPPIVYYTWSVVSTCTACIGQGSSLAWSIKMKDGNQHIHNDDPRFAGYTTESKECGQMISTKLKLYIDDEVRGSRITCTSINSSVNKSSPAHNISETSSSLKVQLGPGPPTISVEYHKAPSELILGWNLTANCSACIHPGRTVYWDVVDEDGDLLDESQMAMLEIYETYSYVDATGDINNTVCDDYLTTYGTSYMSLHVTKALHNARLVCRSYNGTYGNPESYTASSLPFVVHYDRGHKFDYWDFRRMLTGFLPPIFGLLLIILFLLLLLRCMQRKGPIKHIPVQHKIAHKKQFQHGKGAPKKHTIRLKVSAHSQTLVSSTNVDTGEKKRNKPRNAAELARLLKIPDSEARKRIQQELARLQKQTRTHNRDRKRKPGKRTHPATTTTTKQGAQMSPKSLRQSIRRSILNIVRASTRGIPVDALSTASESSTTTNSSADDGSILMEMIDPRKKSVWESLNRLRMSLTPIVTMQQAIRKKEDSV